MKHIDYYGKQLRMVIVNEVWDTKYGRNILLQQNYSVMNIYFKEKSSGIFWFIW